MEKIMEKWVPGYENLYSASEDGRVFSHCKSKFEMRSYTAKSGYKYIGLYKQGKTKLFTLHVLMLLTFIGEKPTTKHECRHLDGNKSHNHIQNLVWGTRQENVEDNRKNGNFPIGDTHFASKLTSQDVRKIRERLKQGELQKVIARGYGLHRSTIGAIKNGLNWKHLV
jgi:hypothetical protein